MTPAQAKDMLAQAIAALQDAIDHLLFEQRRLRNGTQTLESMRRAQAIEQHSIQLQNELRWLDDLDPVWEQFINPATGELTEHRMRWVHKRVDRARQLINSASSF